MKHEEHYDICLKRYGNGYAKVHKWLDEYAYMTYPSTAHRCIRHHQAGIEEVREMWGELAAIAAFQHIKDDLTYQGYPPWQAIPKDREEAKEFYGDIDDHIEGD